MAARRAREGVLARLTSMRRAAIKKSTSRERLGKKVFELCEMEERRRCGHTRAAPRSPHAAHGTPLITRRSWHAAHHTPLNVPRAKRGAI
eukprot:5410872-Prymnesium_polylepis.1